MTIISFKALKISSSLLLAGLLQACAPSSYNVQEPAVSASVYSEPAIDQVGITLSDSRAEAEKTFSFGVLKSDLMLDGEKLIPIEYLQRNSLNELKARGVGFNDEVGKTNQVIVNKLIMKNHRTNAYTPFITLTMLSSDLMVGDTRKRIAVFIKRGKVPVWSFDEIVEPTFNQPLDLLVKEFSAKLNRHLYGNKISDAEVAALVEKVKTSPKDKKSYMNIYQLGFGNNPAAIPALYEFSQSDREYIRMAGISALGIIQAVQYIDYLKDLSNNAKSWADRAMALKAIGDLGTEEAIDFLKQKRISLATSKDKERRWSTEIIDLYL